MKEIDVVALTEDLPEEGLIAGEKGTIVHVFEKPEPAYLVEFCGTDGITTAMPTLLPRQVKLTWSAPNYSDD